jgi:hypothetical protein
LTGIDGVEGVTAMETSAGFTARFVRVLTPPELAVIMAVPSPTPLTRPELLTVSTEGSEDVQLTELVRLLVEPSE